MLVGQGWFYIWEQLMSDERVVELDGFNVMVRGRDALYIANKNDVYVGRALIQYGEYGQNEYDLLEKLVFPGACVLEVGAHIGSHTVRLAKKIGLKGRLVAVEPQPPLFQAMAGAMALNGLMNVDCYPFALGETAKTTLLPAVDYRQENNFGGLSLLNPPTSGIFVMQQRLDDIYNFPKLDIIKIDVEGMELAVLKGGTAIVEKYRPMIYFENDRRELSKDILTWLFERKYKMWWHFPELYNPQNYFSNPVNIYGAVSSINVLALPEEKQANIGLREVINADEFPVTDTDTPPS